MNIRVYFESNAQLRYSNNFLYIFNADNNNAASLMKIPFIPSSGLLKSPDVTKLPLGTTLIEITSTISMCDWQEGYFTAVSGNEFFLLCQPFKNTTSAMLLYSGAYSYYWYRHAELVLLGPDIGTTTCVGVSDLSVSHDTLFNYLPPGASEPPVPQIDGIPFNEGLIGGVIGGLAALAMLAFLALRHRRQLRDQERADAFQKFQGLEAHAVGKGAAQSRQASPLLSPAVYAAPQAFAPTSPAMSAGMPVPPRPSSPPTTAGAGPFDGPTSRTTSESPTALTYEIELQQLGFSSHPRPNFVTTVND
ncbi:unnamed protein product [Mortierella alpina]